jgi:alkylation response protein AidB-like acyl-CoA dehydrogenase
MLLQDDPRTVPNADDASRRARELAQNFRRRAADTERARKIPAESIQELHDAGLFGLLTPKRFGGSELGMDAVLDAAVEIGTGCGATGWVYGVLTGHAWLLTKFPIEAQEEVFRQRDVLIAALIRLGGTSPERVPGGYRWRGGQGKFCSGIDHSQWVIVGGSVASADGPPEHRYFLLPREDVEIVDDWYTVGLRGTGSKSIIVKDAFIPEYRTVTNKSMLDGTAPGPANHSPYYQLPFMMVWPLSLPGTAIGTARAALDLYRDGLRKRVATMVDEQLAEQTPAFVRLADASARIDAAYNVLRTNARRLNEVAGPEELTQRDRETFRRDMAFAVQESRRAADSLFEASGGTGVYDTGDVQRVWRDNNAASQHFGFTWDSAAAAFGRFDLGLPPSKFERNGK